MKGVEPSLAWLLRLLRGANGQFDVGTSGTYYCCEPKQRLARRNVTLMLDI